MKLVTLTYFDYNDLCMDYVLQVHTRLLTHKWHELLVLTTSAYQAIHGPQKIWNSTNMNGDRNDDSEFHQEVRTFDDVYTDDL